MLHANYFSGLFVVSWPMKLYSTLSLLIVQFKGILRTQPSISVVQMKLKSECSEFWLLNRQVITRNTSWSEEFSWSDLFSIVLHRNTSACWIKIIFFKIQISRFIYIPRTFYIIITNRTSEHVVFVDRSTQELRVELGQATMLDLYYENSKCLLSVVSRSRIPF